MASLGRLYDEDPLKELQRKSLLWGILKLIVVIEVIVLLALVITDLIK